MSGRDGWRVCLRGALVVGMCLLALSTAAPVDLAAQEGVPVEGSEVFLGSWVFELESVMGPMELDFRVFDPDDDGVIDVWIGDDEGDLPVEVSRTGSELELSWTEEMIGQLIDLHLFPADEGLETTLVVGGGVFEARGMADRVPEEGR